MPHPKPLVAVVHANAATIAPVDVGFGEAFPDADVWHLVDDRLVTDAERAGGLTEPLANRMRDLIDYAVRNGADAVQLACSMYAPVATETERAVPVRPSDQGMFDQAVAARPHVVAVLASLAPAAEDSRRRLAAAFTEAGAAAEVRAVLVEEAAVASRSGDRERLVGLLQQAVRDLPADVDLVVLAQYTLAPVATAVASVTDVPVLSGPRLAAATLARLVGEKAR